MMASRERVDGAAQEAPLHAGIYLMRWQGADGRVCEYGRPYGNIVKPRRSHPDGTGYVKRLYSIDGAPEDEAHSFEAGFMSPADSLAADALVKLENNGNAEWTPRLRDAWTRFVLSLLVRNP